MSVRYVWPVSTSPATPTIKSAHAVKGAPKTHPLNNLSAYVIEYNSNL